MGEKETLDLQKLDPGTPASRRRLCTPGVAAVSAVPGCGLQTVAAWALRPLSEVTGAFHVLFLTGQRGLVRGWGMQWEGAGGICEAEGCGGCARAAPTGLGRGE